MDLLEVISAEVKHVRREQMDLRKEAANARKDLREHIKEETAQFTEFQKEMHCMNKELALTKQWGRILNGGIATITAGIVSWIVIVFSGHGR